MDYSLNNISACSICKDLVTQNKQTDQAKGSYVCDSDSEHTIFVIYSQYDHIGKNELRNLFYSLQIQKQSKIYVDYAVRCTPRDTKLSYSTLVNKKTLFSNCSPYLKTAIEKVNPTLIICTDQFSFTALTEIYNTKLLTERGFLFPINKKPYPCILIDTLSLNNEYYKNRIKEFIKTAFNKAVNYTPEMNKKYKIINNPKELHKYIEGKKRIAFDFETTTFDYKSPDFRILGFSLFDGQEAVYTPLYTHNFMTADSVQFKVKPNKKGIEDFLRYFLANKHILKIVHNAKFDSHVSEFILGTFISPIFDTVVIGAVFYPRRTNDLKELAYFYSPFGGYEQKIKKAKIKNYGQIDMSVLAQYSCIDARITWALALDYAKVISKKIDYYSLSKIQNIFRENLNIIESQGVPVNPKYTQELLDKYNGIMNTNIEKIKQEYPNIKNIKSSKFLKSFIWGNSGKYKKYSNSFKPNERTTKTEILEKLLSLLPDFSKEKSFLECLIQFKKYQKLCSTYLEVFKENYKIYATYNQDTTRTGRLSCSNPNMQNIPRDDAIRNCIEAPEGFSLIESDFKQLEICILAEYCQDQIMLDMINSKKDIHAFLGHTVLAPTTNLKVKYEDFIHDKDLRAIAKQLIFAIVYGMGPQSLSAKLKCTKSQAETVINTIKYKTFPQLGKWIQTQSSTIFDPKNRGFLYSLFGRPLYLDEMHNIKTDESRKRIIRQAANYPVQSAAVDCVAIAINRLMKVLPNFGSNIIMTVHDSVIILCPDKNLDPCKELIKQVMETKIKQIKTVHLTVDIKSGKNWGSLK